MCGFLGLVLCRVISSCTSSIKPDSQSGKPTDALSSSSAMSEGRRLGREIPLDSGGGELLLTALRFFQAVWCPPHGRGACCIDRRRDGRRSSARHISGQRNCLRRAVPQTPAPGDHPGSAFHMLGNGS